MKRDFSGDMSLLAPFGTSSDAGHGYGMGHQEPKRPCYPEHAQLPSQAGFSNTDMFCPPGSYSGSRSTPFNMQLPEPTAFQVPAAAAQPFMGLAAAVNPARMMAAGQPELRMPFAAMPGMQLAMGGYMQQQIAPFPQQQQGIAGSSAATFASPDLLHASAVPPAAAPPSGSLQAQMRSQQANTRQQQQQQQQQQQVPAGLRLAEDWRPMNELQRLLPRLNQEYKREMALLLKACQVRTAALLAAAHALAMRVAEGAATVRSVLCLHL
jgi:hypothetical protein